MNHTLRSGDHHEDETTSRALLPSPPRPGRRHRGRLRRRLGHDRGRPGTATPARAKTATGTVSTRQTKLGRSSWTPTDAPCTSSRRTRAPPAAATERAPASGLRSTARHGEGRHRRDSGRPRDRRSAATARTRSPTRATRSTPTPATRSPATRGAGPRPVRRRVVRPRARRPQDRQRLTQRASHFARGGRRHTSGPPRCSGSASTTSSSTRPSTTRRSPPSARCSR